MKHRGTNPDGSPHIRRPQNAWILFRTDWSKNNRASRELGVPKTSKSASKVWRSMCDDQQAPWYIRAEQEAINHRMLYPGYKFQPKQPKKKAEKRQKGGATREKAVVPSEDRPKKRRRVGQSLMNSATTVTAGEEVNTFSTCVSPQASFVEAGPSESSQSSATGTPEPFGRDLHMASSFTSQETFTFRVPYTPTEYDFTYANTTAYSDPNAFHFGGDYECPTVCTYGAQIDESSGAFVAGSGRYDDGGVVAHDGYFNYNAHSAVAVASTYGQDVPSAATQTSNAYSYGGWTR